MSIAEASPETGIVNGDYIPLPKARPVYSYYRKPDGDVTVAVVSPMERLAFIEEGWTPLKYPNFDMTTGYAADHPFEALFISGGAHELSRKQCIEIGFHINPPTIPRCRRLLDQNHKKHHPTCYPAITIDLPQVADAESFKCRICEKVFPIEGARRRHENVGHKPEKASMATGTALAEALAIALRPIMSKINRTDLKGVTFSKTQIEVLKKAGIEVDSIGEKDNGDNQS